MGKICQTCARSKTSENSSRQPIDRALIAPFQFRYGAVSVALFFLFLLTAGVCHAQGHHDVVCRDGAGDFEAEFSKGVKVSIGPERNEMLEARSCKGALSWGDQNLEVGAGASEL